MVVAGACTSGPETMAPGVESPPRHRVGRDDPGLGTNFGRETEPTLLFIQLDRQLRTLRDPTLDAQARNQIRPVLTRYVDTNFDLIQKAVEATESRHRLVAAWSLGYASNPRALPLLLDLLRDTSPLIKANALFGLGARKDPATPMKPIYDACSHPDTGVRCNAARAIREILEPGVSTEAIIPLTSMITDEEPRVRLAAVGALAKMVLPECKAFLINALKDPMPLVRAQAALGLGKIKDVSAVPILLSFLKKERNPTPGLSMIKALEAITGQSFKTYEEWTDWWADQTR